MLIDSRTLPKNASIKTDICIIGAGPAGITLAREFINTDVDVCLLESGGLDSDAPTQKLSQGAVHSQARYPQDEFEAGRKRQFGGASNRWHIDLGDQTGVRHAPLDPIDFQLRDWFPHSGWSISYEDLIPYYKKAQQVCKIGPFEYDSEAWITPSALPLPLDRQNLITTIFQFGPRDIFAQQYGSEIRQSKNISVYLYANVTNLVTPKNSDQLSHIQVACLAGNCFQLKARFYILAMGGIENARLLLASNQSHAKGIGNQHDLVGRFYMDHPGFRIGRFIPKTRQQISQMALYDLRQVKGISIAGKLSLSPALLQKEKLVNTSIWFFPRPKGYKSEAIASLKSLLMASKQLRYPSSFLKCHLTNILNGLDDIAAVTYRKLFRKQPQCIDAASGGWSTQPTCNRDYTFFEVAAQVEQSPNPDNRIMLSHKKDVLGIPQPVLDWQWSEIDLHSLHRTQQILQREIAKAGLGNFFPDPEPEKSADFYSAHHHMGTTRMHLDPCQGVVNQNCQVHGCSNLFVAGSSVFPTGSYVNPTLTIVALAIRLADYIKQMHAQDS